MVFTSPSWVPQLPICPPDSISIPEFMSNEKYGRYTLLKTRNPYTCGITGKSYTTAEVIQREIWLSRAIAKRLNFQPERSTMANVVGIFSLNTIDYIPLTHAVHRASGVVTPASAAFSASELEHQLRSSKATALFTCVALLETALLAANGSGIPLDRIFILPMPGDDGDQTQFPTIEDLITEGKDLPEPPPTKWQRGEGLRQVAYLCYSSGTSGLPKATMISHYNVIANVLQLSTYESVARKGQYVDTQVVLGILPFSHIYGLILMGHLGPYRGDELIVLSKYRLKSLLSAVQQFKIEQINIAPPILVEMAANKAECSKHDLSSIRCIFSGGAPLRQETIGTILELYPTWHICQAYGMTETATIVSATSELDCFPGSSGSLLPLTRAKIIAESGLEVTDYETPGELFIQGPSVVLGYLCNDKATADTFVNHADGRWIRTGDEAEIRKSPQGSEHIVIVDRIKELIKVKGIQVAPAELEAHLLTHPWVADCAVIPVPHHRAGEVPKAYVVRSRECTGMTVDNVTQDICKHVETHKAKHKWLVGGVEFVCEIPKSITGKILRRVLRDKEQTSAKAIAAKL